jgi:hypothetical protein
MQLLAFFVSLFLDDAQVAAFQRTAPTYLTHETAREHMASAFAVGIVTDTRPALLLSIAWFESRYTQNVVSREAGGKVSCGVMTPIPQTRCQPSDLVSNYLEGAQHLLVWRRACRDNERCKLLGYGGGYRAIKLCASGAKHHACFMPQSRLFRANLIERGWRGRVSVLRWRA